MDELVYGVFKPEAVAYFQRVIGRMKDEGCDAVVLGCTEIPLIMNDANSPLPTLDSTRLLARAALRRAGRGLSRVRRSEAHSHRAAARDEHPFIRQRPTLPIINGRNAQPGRVSLFCQPAMPDAQAKNRRELVRVRELG